MDAMTNENRPNSPCVAICAIFDDELCGGCGRTITEISNWASMPKEEKNIVWERIEAQGFITEPVLEVRRERL